MKRWCLLIGLVTALAGSAWAGEEYPLGPDSQRQPGVPRGTVTQHTWTSKIFPGTVRDFWVYVPAQYAPEKPACVMLFEDGKGAVSEEDRMRIPIVFDNLIAKHDMPVTIAILIDPGVLKVLAPGQQGRPNRSYEYDDISDRYARFLLDEILPEVGKQYNLSTNPNDRAICGVSSGGICSFTVAWTHPEAFRRVLSFVGSFADHRGGDIYPALIRKTEPKPLRVFLQDGSHDLNIPEGDWWLANQSMASALAYAGYDFKFVTGDKDHDMIQGGAILPDALRWLWRDYPQSISKPAPHPLGDQQSGFVDVAPEWELVNTVSPLPLGTSAGSKDAAGIAVDQQGNVFTSEFLGHSIYRIDREGHVSTFVKGVNGVRGLALGPDERLYSCADEGIVSYAADGKKSVDMPGTDCNSIAVTRQGGLYFTESKSHQVRYVPPGISQDGRPQVSARGEALGHIKANGIFLSPDQSIFYASEPTGKWVWSYQVQGDGTLAYGEPFFRMETPDESSDSGAMGMARDSRGFFYVATFLGIQVSEPEGRVFAIFDGPEGVVSSHSMVSSLAFGGGDHQYLYAMVGNKFFRRHLVRRGGP